MLKLKASVGQLQQTTKQIAGINVQDITLGSQFKSQTTERKQQCSQLIQQLLRKLFVPDRQRIQSQLDETVSILSQIQNL